MRGRVRVCASHVIKSPPHGYCASNSLNNTLLDEEGREKETEEGYYVADSDGDEGSSDHQKARR